LLIQQILGKGSFKKPFETYSRLKPNRDGQSGFTLAGTVQTNPSILSPVAHSTRRGQSNKTDEDDLVDLIQNLNHRVATLGARVVETLFPPVTSRLQRNRHTLLDPPMFGAKENCSFSTMQINISPLTQHDLSTLGYSGDSHIDMHDDPMSLTLLICVSNLAPGTYPGNFYLGETNEWCKLEPFSLLVFRGTGPHGGTQAIASGEPGKFEKRINLILYPRREFVNRTVPIVYPWSPERVADYSFFKDGAACFGTDEYHKAWCTRELFRHLIAANKQYGFQVEDSNLQKAFAAFTGSSKRYIHPESAEGQNILKSINDANEILRSVRPKWVVREELTQKQPVFIPLEEAASQRSTRKQNRTSIPSASESEPPSHSLPQPRPSTRISGMATVQATKPETKVAPASLRSHQPDKGKRVMHKTTNLPDSDSPDGYINVDEEVSDSSSLTITTPSSPSIIEILQRHPLFQLEAMEAEMDVIQSRAELLANKFSKRTPQLSEHFLSQPASLPLPNTEGPTIVERLIQLAEHCQWVTQKSQHLWFYERALVESFWLTVMQVEPLFDLQRLISLFKNDVRGAGFCSRSMIDRVVLMVNRMISMKQDSNTVEATMVFDPKEILREQHQPKFCASVEVKLRPYRGNDMYRHMAQHFREVCGTFFNADVEDRVSHVFWIFVTKVSWGSRY
jgi:hypothetical protein